MLAESPSEDSGSQAKSRSDDAGDPDTCDEDEVGRSSFRAGFCWSRATYPGMLSLAEGVGWM